MEGLRFDLERDAVRVVLTDDGGRVLLFHAVTEDVGPAGWWELPGGGIDGGESYLDAAVREVREETGLRLDPAAFSLPSWRRDTTWRSRGQRRLQHEVVVGARVPGHRPGIRADGQTAYELEVYVDVRVGGRRHPPERRAVLPGPPARAAARLPGRGGHRRAVRVLELGHVLSVLAIASGRPEGWAASPTPRNALRRTRSRLKTYRTCPN